MLLLSSLFTVIWGVYKSAEISTMMEIGSESNVTLINLDINKIDRIKNDILIERAAVSEVLGSIVNEEIEEMNSKLIYCDYEYTKMKYIYLERGNMPAAENEVLVSRKMLNLLNEECKIGSSINLKVYMKDNAYVEKEFVISGIYDGKINSKNNDVIVSDKFFKILLDERKENFKNIGRLDLKLKNTFFIDKQIDEIGKKIGGSEKINTAINWTYEYVFTKDICFIILLIIVLIASAGYLIIYNIFNMSIVRDIKFYGILKTLGTTNKQIKKIIYSQAVYILIAALPAGSILGYSVGKVVLPMVNNIIMDKVLINIETESTVNLWIFLVAALFTSMVVIMSINNSYKIAEKISPIEAIKYSEMDINKGFSKFDFKGKIYRIPLINIMRNKRKTILVVISLSMGLILFNLVFNIVFGFNRETYIEENMEIQYDYRVENKYFASLASTEINDNTGISNELIETLKNNKFILDGGGISIISCNKYSKDMADKDNMCLLTLDDFFIDKYKRNSIINDLKKGNYIILDNKKCSDYKVGDSITLSYDGSSTKEYEIIGFLDFWEYLNLNINDQTETGVIWTRNINNEQKKSKLERYYFDAEKNINSCEIDEFLKMYIDQKDNSVIYKSKDHIEKRYNSMKEYYMVVGITIVSLVGLIGILNYINSSFTEMISSLKVFALLEVIGTTKKEIITMLVYKGVYYSIFTTVFQVLFLIIINSICGSTILTLIPIFISTPLLFCFSIIIPLILYSKIVKGNMVTSLRIF